MQVIFLLPTSEGGTLLKFIIEVNRSVEERRRKLAEYFIYSSHQLITLVSFKCTLKCSKSQ